MKILINAWLSLMWALAAMFYLGSLWSVEAVAESTFVGNGGSEGDVEIAVVKSQVRDSFRAMLKHKDDKDFALCQCNEIFDEAKVCKPLKELNKDQQKFCTQRLLQQANQVLELLDDAESFTIRWTHRKITVQDRGESLAADAATDPKEKTITLNQQRFLSLGQYQRMFLFTHEILHLTKADGKYLSDEGEVGPFAGESGGRQLLNAMGAGVAVLEGDYPSEIREHKAALSRPQSWRHAWVEFEGGSARYVDESTSTFAMDKYSVGQFSARYMFGTFGLVLSYRHENQSKTIYDTIKIKENINILGAGLAFKYSPFDNPMTYMGQSHALFKIMAEYVNAQMAVDEAPLHFEDEATTFGGSASLSYFFPVAWNFWAYGTIRYEYHPYSYDVPKVNYDSGIYSSTLGVSYAF